MTARSVLGSLCGQFMRFAGVGLVGTSAHYLSMALLIWGGLPSIAATTIGAIVGTSVNYWLNYHYTFRSRARHRDAVMRFLAISAVGWFVNALMFHLLHAVLTLHLWLAQIAATGLVLLWNFAGNRYWTFGEDRHD